MKRKLLLLTLLTTLSFSDDAISLPLEEAVQVNTKLIQVLFEENKLLRNELNQIKEKLNVSEMSPLSSTSFVKNAPYSENDAKNVNNQYKSLVGPKNKILMKSAYVRTEPTMRTGIIVGEKEKGTVVNCNSFENNWCKLNKGEYIWGDYLKDAESFQIITNKKAILRLSPHVKAGNVLNEIGSGIVLNAVSYNNGWFRLENNLYISDVTTSKYCK